MTHLSLLNSELICDVDFSENKNLNRLLQNENYSPFVLYPGKSAIPLNDSNAPIDLHTKLKGKSPLIILIDGTWPCAKKMMTLSKNLHQLPRISFLPSFQSQFKIHNQPSPECLATIEATSEVLRILHHRGVDPLPNNFKERLLAPFDWMVNYNIEAAKDPSRSRYRSNQYKLKTFKVKKKFNLFYSS